MRVLNRPNEQRGSKMALPMAPNLRNLRFDVQQKESSNMLRGIHKSSSVNGVPAKSSFRCSKHLGENVERGTFAEPGVIENQFRTKAKFGFLKYSK